MSSIYEERRAQLKAHLTNNDIGTAMISSPANVFYYTGFNSDPHERFMALFIDTNADETVLFVPALDKDAAIQDSDIAKIISISDQEEPFEVVKHAIGDVATSVGIEAKVLKLLSIQQLASIFPAS